MKDKSNNLAQQFIDAYENGAFPFLHAVHMEPVEIGDGKGSLKIVLNDSHLRVGAIMHGGVASALLDTALGLAAATRAPKQHDVVTAQMNINFIKAARIGEELIGEGTILHSGRRTCVAEGRIHNQTGETDRRRFGHSPVRADAVGRRGDADCFGGEEGRGGGLSGA
ncbi:MAG: PaaI family thioesterase [Planctomycetota bacterium]|nr:MAG: PaaI family thioesterase [Planctomycetota bacterium]